MARRAISGVRIDRERIATRAPGGGPAPASWVGVVFGVGSPGRVAPSRGECRRRMRVGPGAGGGRRQVIGWSYGLVVIEGGAESTQADETKAPLFARIRK